jgi:hypothetical protein
MAQAVVPPALAGSATPAFGSSLARRAISRSVSPPRCHAPSTQPGPGASGRAVAARPPDARARAHGAWAALLADCTAHARASPAPAPCAGCACRAHCPRRAGYEPNTQARPGGRGAPARLPGACRAAWARCSCSSPTALASCRLGARAVCTLARLEGGAGTEPVPRAGFPANEGSAAREAAFRIEPRAPDSPAQRRANVRSERAAAAQRASGPAVTACPPDSRARAWGLRPRCSCSSPPALASSARRKCGGARCRGFESVAGTEPRSNGLSRAQASLPTKAAPPVKRRLASRLVRRLLLLSAARACQQDLRSVGHRSGGGLVKAESRPAVRSWSQWKRTHFKTTRVGRGPS